MTIENPPQYANRPVILVHLTVGELIPEGELPRFGMMYWCAPYSVVEPDEGAYSDIPRVQCPACAKAGL